MSNDFQIIKEFLIGGTFVAGISYIGNYVDPLLAGLLAGVPIGLPSAYFILSKQKSKEYVRNLALTTIVLTFVTILFYFTFVKYDLDKNIGIAISMGIWLLIVLILWKTRISEKIIV